MSELPKVVYTGGTFDLIHPGHIQLLAQCRRMVGMHGIVVVSLNRDAFVQRYKGHAPVMRYTDRAAVLAALTDVDKIVCNQGDEDSRPAIRAVAPDIIAIGADWRDRDYHAQMGFDQAWLDARGIELRYVELLEGHSSSELRRRGAQHVVSEL